jgi:hypothetical protein
MDTDSTPHFIVHASMVLRVTLNIWETKGILTLNDIDEICEEYEKQLEKFMNTQEKK